MEPGYMDKVRAEARDDVDPRLDNRTGSDRPVRQESPAVPQQVDGPDLMHQAEHAQAVADASRDAGGVDRMGMFSYGDHSTGNPEDRGGNHAGQGDSVLETDPGNPASESTSLKSGDAYPAADPLQAEEVAKDAKRASGADSSETATAGPGERRSRSAKATKE
jgi:hypothetical protein